MVALGGPTAAGDDALKLLYDLDELNHRYHIIKKLTPAQAVEYKARIRKRNRNKLFVPDAQRIVFRTVGRGKNRRVIAMRRRIYWKAKANGGHSYRPQQVPRIFGDRPIVPKDEFK